MATSIYMTGPTKVAIHHGRNKKLTALMIGSRLHTNKERNCHTDFVANEGCMNTGIN